MDVQATFIVLKFKEFASKNGKGKDIQWTFGAQLLTSEEEG